MSISRAASGGAAASDLRALGIYRPENYANLSNPSTVAGTAVQAAITAASAAGGTVQLGARTYLMGSTTLVIPEADPFNLASGHQVNIIGVGRHASILKWTTDLGAGTYAISCGDPTATNTNGLGRYATAFYDGVCADFSMVGPGTTLTLGVAPCAMSGFAWGSRRDLHRIGITGFYAALDIVGDNSVFEEVYSENNYYGAYWNQQSDNLYGDLVFTKCFFENANMAAVGVHPLSQGIKGAHFNSCYFSQSPYGIFLEAGGGSFPQILADVVFDNCMFEGLGNAMFHDDNATKKGIAFGVDFRKSLFGWKDAKLLTTGGRTRRAMIDLAQLTSSSFRYPRNPQQFVPGSVGLWVVDQFKSVQFVGDVRTVITACATAGQPWIPIGSAGTSFTGSQVTLEEPGILVGTFSRVASFSATITAGDVLVHASDAVQQGFLSTLQPVAGVALAGAAASGAVPMATGGNNVTVTTSGTVSVNQWIKRGNAGAAVAAVAQNDAGVVGWVKALSGAVATVMLKPANTLNAFRPLRTNTASMTLALTEGGSTLELSSASGVTLTVPPNSSVAFPIGTAIEVTQTGAGQITIAAGAGVTLRTPRSLTTRAQYSTVTLRQRAVDEWVLGGDLT